MAKDILTVGNKIVLTILATMVVSFIICLFYFEIYPTIAENKQQLRQAADAMCVKHGFDKSSKIHCSYEDVSNISTLVVWKEKCYTECSYFVQMRVIN